MVHREDGSTPMLTEILADDEAQLQEIIKDNPDLLPVDEFGMAGPLMIVGRKTTLPSGYVDLACLSRSGDLLLVEFKTGPQNSGFRHVLAQLLDYGSDLWRMTYEEFESTVANRFFSSDRCRDERTQNAASLHQAALAIWYLSEQEVSLFQERLAGQLATGAFHYIIVAQRFTPTMKQTVEYLNAITPAARFYAVELVRFAADGITAFESRTVLKPVSQSPSSPPGGIDEARLLEQIEDDAYRRALKELLEVCRGLGLQLPWGKVGTSVRLRTSIGSRPLSVAWLFPPGVSGWMGLLDLTLGYWEDDELTPSAVSALEDYVARVAALPGAEPAKPKWLRGYRLKPDTTIRHQHEITEVLAELVQRIGQEA